MPRKPKLPPMTDQEMDNMNLEVVQSQLYNRDVSPSVKVSAIVNTIGESLKDAPERIWLDNTEAVKEICRRYIDSCCRTGSIPSKTGLARALGHSRQSLRYWCAENPNTKSAQFLQMAFDAFSEMLSSSSLSGGCQPIVGIFLLKALYGVRENEPEPDIRSDPLGPHLSAEEIAAKYALLPGGDDEEEYSNQIIENVVIDDQKDCRNEE